MNITQRDIARAAGLSLATVARVLRDHPNVRPETRRKVMRAVEATGYRHNPLVDAWAAHFRETHRHSGFTLAHLSDYPESDMAARPVLRALREGIRRKLESFGGGMDAFHVGAGSELRDQRLQNILHSRGIDAVLCGPFRPDTPAPELQWEAFSIAGIGNSKATEPMNRVMHNRYLTLREALSALLRAGYRRPGLAGFGPTADDHSARGWLPAYLFHLSALPAKDRVPWLPLETPDAQPFSRWLNRHRPDVVISPHPELHPLARNGASPDSGFFCLELSPWDNDDRLAGVRHPSDTMGRAVVDLLLAQCDTHDRGLPKFPRNITFQGGLRSGDSCPGLSSSLA